MKKEVVILIIFLSILPLISAVEINMKTNFSQGETLLAKISGTFVQPLVKENIFLYQGHVRIPFDPYVSEINGDFYIYGQLLEKQPGNYSLSIENVKYMKAGSISEENLVKNFTINENLADFLIEPGFIVTDKDFFIKAQNLQDYKITISKEVNNLSENLTLKSGETKKINFEIKDFPGNLTFSFIELSTDNLKYNIPVYIIFKETPEKKGNLILKPSELNVSLSTNSNITRIIYLFNDGQGTLENISLSISDSLLPYVFLFPEKIEKLDENSSTIIKLQINSSNKEEKLEGQITAKTNELYSYTTLFINIIKDFVPSEKESIFPTCGEIGGKICEGEEICEGKTENTKDGVCCLGTCVKKEKSPIGRIIAIILVVGIIALLIWFYKKKYKGAKKEVNLLEIVKGKK